MTIAVLSSGAKINVSWSMLVGKKSVGSFEVSDKADTNVR